MEYHAYNGVVLCLCFGLCLLGVASRAAPKASSRTSYYFPTDPEPVRIDPDLRISSSPREESVASHEARDWPRSGGHVTVNGELGRPMASPKKAGPLHPLFRGKIRSRILYALRQYRVRQLLERETADQSERYRKPLQPLRGEGRKLSVGLALRILADFLERAIGKQVEMLGVHQKLIDIG